MHYTRSCILLLPRLKVTVITLAMTLNGSTIGRLMLERGWSPETLASNIAAFTGKRCHYTTIARMLAGRVTRAEPLIVTAKLLGVPVEELVTLEAAKRPA